VARTPDPTALEPEDAENVRALVRAVRGLTKTTNQDLADHLGWDVRKVTDALTEGRTLLAERALALARASAEARPAKGRPQGNALDNMRAQGLLLDFWRRADWVRTYRDRSRPAAALIPIAEADRLAEALSKVVASVNGVRIGEQKQMEIRKALRRYFRSHGGAMAMTWNEITGPAVHHIIEEAIAGRGPWAPHLRLRNRKPSGIARVAVYVAAAIGFPKTDPEKRT
jgi:hypothetical protein